MPGPLSHIRVLDLSRIMAGPWSGQILADLGADVIKVERAGEGDDTRRWGPPFLKDKNGDPTKEAGYYLSVNRGKRSVALDLKSEEGQAAVRALAADSDILLENFKTGTLDRMGLGFEDLKKVNPRLIYCSLTGFGLDGPMANDAAYDFMIQGMGGLMSVTGAPDDAPGGGPQKVGVPIIDITTGMYATIGVLAALANRDQTGTGDHIDLAMLDVSVAMLANQAMNYLVSGKPPVRRGNRHPNIQPQNVYPVSDGHIVLAVGNDGQFRKFCTTIGLPDLADDPDYATNAARVENLPKLEEILVDALAKGSVSHWVSTFAAAGVPSGPINTVDRVFEEPQVKHRKMLRDIPHPLGGDLKQVVSPLNFRNAPLSFAKAPPLLGEHTEEVLGALVDDAGENHDAVEGGVGPARINFPMPEDMNTAQRQVYDQIVSGPRGTLVGPLRAALLNPTLADRWQRLGQVLRFETSLPAALNELAILVTARRWNSDLEWAIHLRDAERAGLNRTYATAILACRAPDFGDDAPAREVYEFARQIVETGHVDDAAYNDVLARWGEVGAVELTAVVGYYSMVAMTLNAHRIPLPDGMTDTLPGRRDKLSTMAPTMKD